MYGPETGMEAYVAQQGGSCPIPGQISTAGSPMLNNSMMNPVSVPSEHPPPWTGWEIPYNGDTSAQQYPAPKEVQWIPKVHAKLRVLNRELGAPYLMDAKSGGFAIWNESALKKYYAGIFRE